MGEALQGNLIIVAAPSGGGKTSLVKKLVENVENTSISISHTTRAKRPKEQEGIDYFFVSKAAFLKMAEEHAFLEYAKVFDHYYGTSLEQIDNMVAAGIDVVLDIDWQGAAQIKKLYPDAISIFIIPPSLEVLKKRLVERGQDKKEIVANRMRSAQDELSHYKEFDFLIVNDNFEKAAEELQAIVISSRLDIKYQAKKQKNLLSFLLSSQ